MDRSGSRGRWEALWANVTVFDPAAPALRLRVVRELTLDDMAGARSGRALWIASRVGADLMAVR